MVSIFKSERYPEDFRFWPKCACNSLKILKLGIKVVWGETSEIHNFLIVYPIEPIFGHEVVLDNGYIFVSHFNFRNRTEVPVNFPGTYRTQVIQKCALWLVVIWGPLTKFTHIMSHYIFLLTPISKEEALIIQKNLTNTLNFSLNSLKDQIKVLHLFHQEHNNNFIKIQKSRSRAILLRLLIRSLRSLYLSLLFTSIDDFS